MASFAAGVTAYQKRDFATARKEWEAAAKAGDLDASYQLGLMHANGVGVPQDFVKAREYFTKPAEADHTDAQYSLGVLYHVGLGTEENPAEGAYWYQKAA